MSRRKRETREAARPRPAWLRALGPADPPRLIEAGGVRLEREKVLKHDAWAATARYRTAEGGAVVCKFNRCQPVLGIPMRWLGRALARREAGVLRRLEGVPEVPPGGGEVTREGRALPHAVARHYVEGHPLTPRDRVDDAFFPDLARTLKQVHQREVAHADLNKAENIIVGEDGRPHLIDFQIHFALPLHGPGRWGPPRWLLRVLQRSDEYHLLKHRLRYRPDQLPAEMDLNTLRPWWIRGWRGIATPFRQTRRRLLVMLGVRRGRGHGESEHIPEEAVQRRNADRSPFESGA